MAQAAVQLAAIRTGLGARDKRTRKEACEEASILLDSETFKKGLDAGTASGGPATWAKLATVVVDYAKGEIEASRALTRIDKGPAKLVAKLMQKAAERRVYPAGHLIEGACWAARDFIARKAPP